MRGDNCLKVLDSKDIKIFETFAALPQKKVGNLMMNFLSKHYSIVERSDGYIYAEGTIPVALVAHMDTVCEDEKSKIKIEPLLLYDREKEVMTFMYPTFDDITGIFVIIKLISAGYKPHIILTEDEELGCKGAEKLIKKNAKSPFKELKYLIQVDRRGTNDCVFYDCCNLKFIDYIEKFGFKEAHGSFSDISVIAPSWGVAAVNLSVGYYNEHSYQEVLLVPALLATIEKIKNILDDVSTAETFEYISEDFDVNKYFSEEHICQGCKKIFESFEMIPVRMENGEVSYYCPDCCSKNIDWCVKCGHPFFQSFSNQKVCKECKTKKGGKKIKCMKKSKKNLTV